MESPDTQDDEHYGRTNYGLCIPCIQTGPLTIEKKYFRAPVFVIFFERPYRQRQVGMGR